MQTKPYDTPSSVEAEDGMVFVDGPDGLAVTMTPNAAADTSDRLLQAAIQAQGQQIEMRRLREEEDARRTM